MVGDKKTLLVIGCGNMGAAIAAGAVVRADTQVIGLDPNIERARELLSASPGLELIADVRELGDRKPDQVILATKPASIPSVLESASEWIGNSLIISIAAGVPISALSAVLPHNKRLVRVMPNLPAQVRAGMMVGYCNAGALVPTDEAATVALFQALGRFQWLRSEHEIDIATAISGSGPGYLFAFAEQLTRAGEKLGLASEVAEELARQTLVGAGRLLELDSRTASDLKAAVTSPGGTTQAGLSVLESEAGLPFCVSAATAAAAKRARELSHAPLSKP
jgi:pyrroline-5-carboxylate reductase